MKRTTFKILRLQSGKKATEIAEKLEISISTYRKYESLVYLPSASVLTKMNQIYGCTLEEVMEAYKYQESLIKVKKEFRN